MGQQAFYIPRLEETIKKVSPLEMGLVGPILGSKWSGPSPFEATKDCNRYNAKMEAIPFYKNTYAVSGAITLKMGSVNSL